MTALTPAQNLSSGSIIHFIGIGGIGVSALARLLKGRGAIISGSDMVLPPVEHLPVGSYFEGHRHEHVPADAVLVIYSPAVGENNPERKAAAELGIPALSYPEALAWITKSANTIAISGTHGKSTTTALAGLLFDHGGFDPTVIVGAEINDWPLRNLRPGKEDLFIVEACEYRRHMLNLSPQAILITNIELDHPDYYRDLNDVKNAFREYVEKLSGDGLLVVNNDDANLRTVRNGIDAIVVTYGIGEGADLIAKNIHEDTRGQTFELYWKGSALGTFTTPLPGLYNIYNILGAMALYCGYSGNTEKAKDVIAQFPGVGRRFEVLGENSGTTIISDYAHHPTALAAVVNAAKSRYSGKNILVVFRPHHRERTQKLFNDFVSVISNISHCILVEIYDVHGREEGADISSLDLVKSIRANKASADIVYAGDLAEASALVNKRMKEFDVVLVVGAGDADKLAKELLTNEMI